MAASAATSAYASYQGAHAQAALANRNATMANRQAADVLQRSSSDVGRIRQQGSQIYGQALNQVAASGVETTSGSVANIFSASEAANAADVARLKSNAAREAYGYKVEAQNLRTEAKRLKRYAILGSVGPALGAAGDIAAYKASRE